MTPAEKYFAFLDLCWPSNPVLNADLDTCFDPDYVEGKWREFRERRVYTRLMPTADLSIVDGGTSQDTFFARSLPGSQWDSDLTHEAERAQGLERTLACHYVASPEEGTSRLYLLGHHSTTDGRGGLAELRAFLQFLDGRDVPTQDRISRPPEPTSAFDWQEDRRALLGLLQELSDRNRVLGPPLPGEWPESSPERTSRGHRIVLDPETSAAVMSRARAEGVRVFAAMAAAWLQAVAGAVCDTDSGILQLNVPVDRAVPSDDPRRPTAMNVGVIGHRYAVEPGNHWPLAREVAATVERAVGRGEGELFFHLARLDRITDLARGVDTVGTSIREAPPGVSVTNMGLIDSAGDPSWVSNLCGNLAATPNQVISFSTLGYRGQLCSTVWTDDSRMSPARSDQLVADFLSALL